MAASRTFARAHGLLQKIRILLFLWPRQILQFLAHQLTEKPAPLDVILTFATPSTFHGVREFPEIR